MAAGSFQQTTQIGDKVAVRTALGEEGLVRVAGLGTGVVYVTTETECRSEPGRYVKSLRQCWAFPTEDSVKPKSGDPGAFKYQSTFATFVQKIAAVPKEAVEEFEQLRPRGVKMKRRRKTKTK